jgi:ATP:ADP antiporter, AAA family
MTRRPFLQRLLNVRPSEWKVVTHLFWLQFFMGTGIAFFFTASFFHFLERFSASGLAWVMLLSSPLLFITGWLFSKFEHHFHLIRVGTVIVILMAASILTLQLISNLFDDNWFYYFTFAWYYVLYLASSLCFWSITSTLFDVRQSKRLFALISGGDIPAKLIGYTIAYFFVKAVGPLNLMWPAFFSVLLALPFLFKLSKSGVIHHHHHKENAVEYIPGKGIWIFLKRYTLNTLIRRLAILTFLISASLAIINYAFYTEVKEAQQDDKILSGFIILFMAASQVIALLVKIIFTGRIVASLGIKGSLLITPVILLLLLCIIFGFWYFMPENKMIFYVFGIAAIAVEVLRITITNPVFLTVMQPLNPNERSKAHSIVKGIMDPFAFFLTGGLLILLTKTDVKDELFVICIILCVLSLCWILSVFLVNKSYYQTLVKTISSRFFSQDEFLLSDEEIRHQLTSKIETGSEAEVINILQMLNSHITSESKELIFKFLHHPSDNIKKATLQLIQYRNLTGAEIELKQLADHSENEEIRLVAVQTLCKEQNTHAHQKHYLNHHDTATHMAALNGMLRSVENEVKEKAEKIVTAIIISKNTEHKKLILQTLADLKYIYSHPLHHLFYEDENEIQTAALKAVGSSASQELLKSTIRLLPQKPLLVTDALHEAGENSVPIIMDYLKKESYSEKNKERLIATLGKIDGETSQMALLDLLQWQPSEAGSIVKALHRSRYKTTIATQKKFEEISLAFIVYAAELLAMQNKLEKEKDRFEILARSLAIELTEIRNILISLFGCLYDHEKAFKIKQGLDMKKREQVANAMELVEMTAKKELALPFNKLFEPTDTDHRLEAVKKLLIAGKLAGAEEIFSRILKEQPVQYTSWTKACSLYISKKTNIFLQEDLIKPLLYSENKLLVETATFALKKD